MKFSTYEELDEFVVKTNPGAFSTFDMEIFVPEVEKLRENEIYLEIGVDKGKSLKTARTVANDNVVVCGIDIKEDPFIPKTRFYRGRSGDVAKVWKLDHGMWKVSLLFIDGDHSYLGCKTDLDSWLLHMKKNGVILLHDCDESSPGVLQAASEFVNTHVVNHFELFKRVDRNTSMAKIQL